MHPDHNTLIVAEADHAAVPAAERRATENGMDTDGQQGEVQDSAAVRLYSSHFVFFAKQHYHACCFKCLHYAGY